MFSIVIPVYNKADTIRMSIDSILKQTYKDFEIIVINDGSTDNINDAISIYDDKRIRIINQMNAGVSSARNAGITNSKNSFICFLDADDIWQHNHLEILKNMINRYPQSGMYVTSHRVIKNDGSYIDSNQYLKNIEAEFIYTDDLFEILLNVKGTIIHTNSVCINKRAFDLAGLFEPGVKIGEDTDMWYRIAAYHSVVLSKKVTTEYHRQFSTATRSVTIIPRSIFEERENKLLSDERINLSKRKNISILYDKGRIRKCMLFWLNGEKKEARKMISNVIHKEYFKKKILKSKLMLLIPHRILLFLYITKNKHYFNR